jgi:hypothetical protein
MDTIQNIIFVIGGIIYLIYSALNAGKKAKKTPPAAGDTPVLPQSDIPSLEDLLREIGRKGQQGKESVKEKAKGPARRVPASGKGPAPARTGEARSPGQSGAPEPFTSAQNHTFERRPSYEQLEQSDVSYEQEPSADQLAPRLERVPRYVNEGEAVNYEDPKRSAYAGLDTRKPRFEPFEQEQKKVNRYAKLLSNPQSAREAFILTEIFRRKY